jgi:hypothetical protein
MLPAGRGVNDEPVESAWTPEQALKAAIEHRRAGRSEQAEPFCRLVLAADPDHAEVLHLLGVLASHRGLDGREVALAGAHQARSSAPTVRRWGRRVSRALAADAANVYLHDLAPHHLVDPVVAALHEDVGPHPLDESERRVLREQRHGVDEPQRGDERSSAAQSGRPTSRAVVAIAAQVRRRARPACPARPW